MFNNWFRFKPGRAQGLGIGAEGMALLPTQTQPRYDGFMRPRYQVRGGLNPLAGAMVDFGHKVLPVDLIGNGAFLQGQLELQSLAKPANPGN